MHLHVKHGGLSLRRSLHICAASVAAATALVLAPLPVIAQGDSTPIGLPDLISDPSFIWFNETVDHPVTGEPMLAMAFDGYIHNIGTGSLDVAGNPQVPGGMKQRVWNGSEWETVGEPLVRFETDDGHNHFHLIEAVDYALWSDDRTTFIGDASKVGFCLIDTEQLEEQYEAFYTIEDNNYCGIDSPDLTELRMGITPGWRDTYQATVTLQWVDVSNVLPGWYWVSAEMDPNNEIVESNEDNNAPVFSMNRYPVDGFNARPLPPQQPGPIQLKADSYGMVGDRAFVVTEGPRGGVLDIPVGVDILHDTITYTPNEDFAGTDSFTYYAHDTASAFPHDPREIVVEVNVDDDDVAVVTAGGSAVEFEVKVPNDSEWASDRFGSATAFAADGNGAIEGLQWFGAGLPPGLTVHPDTGEIAGSPTLAGTYESEIVAWVAQREVRTPMTFVVEDSGTVELEPANDFSTAQTRHMALYLGTGVSDASYEATGLPDGTDVSPNLPLIGGTPTEIGAFDVTLRALVDGEVVDEIEFTWTVRPSIRPAFPL